MAIRKTIALIPWWYWVIAVDLLLILVTAGRDLEYSQSWRLRPAFDLAVENNLAVWWHGVFLISVSMLCYEFYLDKIKGFDRQWLSLSVVFFILAVDETCSLHERLPIIIGGLIFIPLLLFLASYPLITFLKDIKNHKTGLFLFFGFGFYASVFALEIIAHVVDFPLWFTPIRIAFEEGVELSGTLIILYGLVLLRESVPGSSFLKIIPKLQLNSTFRAFLWFAISAQILISLIALPNLDDLDIRGNPEMFFPMMINFMLFCSFFWRSQQLEKKEKAITFLLSNVFLISSMGCMYNLLPLIPKADILIPESSLIEGFRLLYLTQIISAVIFITISGKSIAASSLLLIAMLGGIYALSFSYESYIHIGLLLGLFSFFISHLFSRLER